MPYKRSRLRSCGSSTAAAGCVPEVTGRGLSTAGVSRRGSATDASSGGGSTGERVLRERLTSDQDSLPAATAAFGTRPQHC